MARPREQHLPGIEKGIPELEELGFQYAVTRDKRQAILKEEVALKNKVIPLMQQHSMTEYTTEGITMKLIPGKTTLKVTADKAGSDEDGEGDGDGEE